MTPLEHALFFYQRGFSVFPVPRPRPGVPAGQPGDGKTPSLPWRLYQEQQATEGEIRYWFSGEPMNIAIITGDVSGIVALDLDNQVARNWWVRRHPYTPWQVKTARGFHVLYRHPGVLVRNRQGLDTPDEGRLKIDVRGDGGYCITAGSVHASGARYELAGEWDKSHAAVPRFWPGWVQRPARPAAPRPNLPRPTGDVVDRARRYLQAIRKPEIGAGSDVAVFTLACRLVRGFQLAEADAEALLWEWAGGRTGWTRAWVAAKVRSATRSGSEPIGAYL